MQLASQVVHPYDNVMNGAKNQNFVLDMIYMVSFKPTYFLLLLGSLLYHGGLVSPYQTPVRHAHQIRRDGGNWNEFTPTLSKGADARNNGSDASFESLKLKG